MHTKRPPFYAICVILLLLAVSTWQGVSSKYKGGREIYAGIDCCISMPCPVYLCGEAVSSTGPLLCYIKSSIYKEELPTDTEISNVIAEYPSVQELQRDIILGLKSESYYLQHRVLGFLVDVHEFRENITEYKDIKKFIGTPAVYKKLRLLHNQEMSQESSDELDDLGVIIAPHQFPIMFLIGYYEVEPLYDIIFGNSQDGNSGLRSEAYRMMSLIGDSDKKKTLRYLHQGLKDDARPYGWPWSVKDVAADVCVELGGWFHVLLWIHSQEYRNKLWYHRMLVDIFDLPQA